MKIKLRKNEHGAAVGKFQDLYGVTCSIQKSSIASIDAIWLGRDAWRSSKLDCSDHNVEHARMHLDQETVAALLPLLKRFVKTGELEG